LNFGNTSGSHLALQAEKKDNRVYQNEIRITYVKLKDEILKQYYFTWLRNEFKYLDIEDINSYNSIIRFFPLFIYFFFHTFSHNIISKDPPFPNFFLLLLSSLVDILEMNII